ncbi:MAG TPA: cupin domain-containing protein [Aliidongia sp.]|nr:cupin domain-containing protein [Aliidongia sp.]
MSEPSPHIVNIDDAEEVAELVGERWGGYYKLLTPPGPRLGHLGVNVSRVPPGRTACPFHSHQLEDEVFYILSGRGVLRYGSSLRVVGPGDCITCQSGTGVAHQLVNGFDEDLVYLSVGMNDPNEVCVYPDSGKVMVRALHEIGYLSQTEYFEGEPEEPRIFSLAKEVAQGKPHKG